MRIKLPNVAGSFYPSDPVELRKMVEDFLVPKNPVDRAQDFAPLQNPVRAFIAPHAGYVYSGRVAGLAYAQIDNTPLTSPLPGGKIRIIILAPSHYFGFSGVATADYDAFQTPLGNISSCAFPGVPVQNEVFEHEHSLEVHLPFLQVGAKNLSPLQIFPLLYGNADPKEIAEILRKGVSQYAPTIIVVSSDLSHFLTDEQARARDIPLCKAIAKGDPKEVKNGDACGIIGITALLHLAQKMNWEPHFLGYQNSSATSGDFERVVGYGAFAFTE